jgi:hypothetical protein
MNAVTKPLGLSLVLAAAWLSGCSGKQADHGEGPTRTDELQDVAGMLRDYTATYNRGPSKAADLTQYQSTYPFGYRAVQSGELKVVWGATMGGEGGGGREVVIAYEKKVPSEGGAVLLENGTVKEMSADEFNAAKPK